MKIYNNNKIFRRLLIETEKGDEIDKMIAEERLRRYSYMSLTADDMEYLLA